MESKITCQSEYRKLKSLFIKNPRDAFINQEIINSQWEDLNFLSSPDFIQACEEYKLLESFYIENGIELKYFPFDESVTIDSIYCRDASIATDYGIILCNMGKDARLPEPAALRKCYEKEGINILGEIYSPGKLEGGDVTWLDQSTLAVGHGYRSNDEGFAQLKNLLAPFGIETIQVDLPHYKGKNDVFHLMSIISPVDKDLAVIYSPLMPVRFRDLLKDMGYGFVEVPREEFDMGGNVLAIAPRRCAMVDGFPITKSRLEDAGCEVFVYPGNEISIKGGGGPTCLTRPMWRYISR